MSAALIALLVAFVIDITLGDPPNRFHPVVAMGSLIRWGKTRLNSGSAARRFWMGTILILLGGALFSIPWLALSSVWTKWPFWLQGLLVGILLKPMFAFRGLLRAGKDVQMALQAGDLSEARRLVAWHLVSRNTSQLSEGEVASATIESLAENLTDSFLSPLLCFSIGGLPLAWFYRFVNTADAMIGYHNEELEYFGKFAARLDDVLNYIPARLAGFALVLAALLSRQDVKAAWNAMLTQHNQTSSPNAGWTMAAAAGSLGVILEKPGHYSLRGGTALPQAGDIPRADTLVRISLLISLLICAGGIFGIFTLL